MSRSLFWLGLRWLSLEQLQLELEPVAQADGLVVGELDGTPFRLHYSLECDSAWRVLRILVERLDGRAERIELSADESGRWSNSDGRAQAGLAGCVDVDISATPFTNTLPIRRLGLEPGRSSEIDVLYVAVFPTLELTRVRQRYTCLEAAESAARYLYESLATGFRAELVVDSDGLVIDYPGVWVRQTDAADLTAAPRLG